MEERKMTKTELAKLPTAEIERRIYEMVVILLECKRTPVAEVNTMAERIAVECFGVEAESEQAYYLGAKVADRYVLTHGEPKVLAAE